ncbi:MAG: prolyl oligopeptidase family serine peptidase [Rhodococcus sp. (in: high G+C Gram-positive bacteria)]|uniref:alpha/beta hydrolase family protein n=1 Tax=Rhodococcus sp. TaxID=1831 RepID=UPI003BB7EADA
MPEFPAFAPRPHRAFSAGFYPDADFDYEVRGLLGAVAYGAAEAGEVLATIDSVGNHDHEHWFRAWHHTASEVRAAADAAAVAGHRASAAQGYLRAATYFAVAVNAVSGLGSDELLPPTFRAHRSSWDGFVDTTDYLVERVDIPYEHSSLPGYFFAAPGTATARPTLIMVNGSDGAISGLWRSGASAALARGYHVLMFDGPGQQSMLFGRGIGFRPDWEAVLTPVVDVAVGRADVDATRLALYGISQGGYWIARALTREHRFAAAIADPGVVDVAASWTANIPAALMTLFRDGKKEAFDRDMALGLKFSPGAARTWRFRARPYRQSSFFDTLTEVHRYALDDEEAARITTPLFLTDPEDEQFWPGQSRRLADIVGGPAHLARFTASEGANFHCQPMARQLTDARMFDWLDDTLGR